MPSGEALLDPEQLAQWLGVSLFTVAGWRARGGGPKYLRLGRRLVRYRAADVERWLAAARPGARPGAAT